MNVASRIDGPVAVIGDVHGQLDKLSTILERLQRLPDYQQRWIVFIGDFVDRGPDPKGVIDMVTDLMIHHERTTAVTGNHEFAMAASLDLIPTPGFSNWDERWLDHYSADTTFDSYGVDFGDLEGLRNAMPENHRNFLANLPWMVEHPQYIFVHAGLDQNTSYEMQLRILRAKDFTLNRPPWLCSKTFVKQDPPPDCPKAVVSGHVMVPEVEISSRRVLVDTTGGFEGDLSCVLLPENVVVTSGTKPAMIHASSMPRPTEKLREGSSRSWWKIW